MRLNTCEKGNTFWWSRRKQGKKKMATLLKAYRAAPTAANRAKLARYLDRHPMALCFATTEEHAFLQANWFIA
jgi:hypothetical protein